MCLFPFLAATSSSHLNIIFNPKGLFFSRLKCHELHEFLRLTQHGRDLEDGKDDILSWFGFTWWIIVSHFDSSVFWPNSPLFGGGRIQPNHFASPAVMLHSCSSKYSYISAPPIHILHYWFNVLIGILTTLIVGHEVLGSKWWKWKEGQLLRDLEILTRNC